MTPTFCPYHQHWTDGPCAAGKRTINRNDAAIRIAEIEALLGDDESAASRGYLANQALELERGFLTDLRKVLK